MYSPLPFGFAQVLVEVPYCILQAVLYGTITYALMCFEWTAAKYWYYILFTVLTILFFYLLRRNEHRHQPQPPAGGNHERCRLLFVVPLCWLLHPVCGHASLGPVVLL